MGKENVLVERRATGLLIIEVRNSNPNGDPDRESDPRQRNHNGRGEITPVSFKRKVRDLIEWKDGLAWQEIKKKFTPELNDEEFMILESRERGFKDVKDAAEAWRKVLEIVDDETKMRNKYWDARVFGSTFLEKGEESPEDSKDQAVGGQKDNKKKGKKKEDKKYIKTGIVQFGLGISVSPVLLDRCTLTKKASAEESKDRGMAPLGYRVVEHGVYYMPFFVNPLVAHKSGCRQKDIDVLLKTIPLAYKGTPSMPRNCIEIRHAWYMEHKSAWGSCSDFTLLDALTPKRKGDTDEQRKANTEKPSTSWDDYDVPTQLPSELRNKLDEQNGFKDLVNE